MTVLVVYATAHGSSRGIAERIAAELSARGCAAVARPVAEVTDAARYSAFVLGSAVHNQSWLPEAVIFACSLAPTLAGRPVWLFSVSSVGDTTSVFAPGVARFIRRARKVTQEIETLMRLTGARGHRNFAGVVQRSDWPLAGVLFLKLFRGTFGDHRDWVDVEGWAAGIAGELNPPSAQPS